MLWVIIIIMALVMFAALLGGMGFFSSTGSTHDEHHRSGSWIDWLF